MKKEKIHIDNFFKDKIKNQDPLTAIPDFNDLFPNGMSAENTSSNDVAKSLENTPKKIYSLPTLITATGITLIIGFILGFYTATEIIKREKDNKSTPFKEQQKAIIDIKKGIKDKVNKVEEKVNKEVDNTKINYSEQEENRNNTEPLKVEKEKKPTSNRHLPSESNALPIIQNDEVITTTESKDKENIKEEIVPNTKQENQENSEENITLEKENITPDPVSEPEKEESEDNEEGIDLFIK